MTYEAFIESKFRLTLSEYYEQVADDPDNYFFVQDIKEWEQEREHRTTK